MEKIYKIAVVIFNICIILAAGITTALTLASSPKYYREQFDACGVYSEELDGGEVRHRIYFIGGDPKISATFSDEQYDLMIDHITEYLFGDKESFELILDGVEIYGVGTCGGVSIFSENAISHMADVKALIKAVTVIGAVAAVLAVALLAFFIFKRKGASRYLLRYTGYFYAAVGIFILGFCVWSLIGAWVTETTFLYRLWGNLHYLLFPFQPEKYENSYLADPLTQILRLELFINALVTVILTVALTVALWLLAAYFIERITNKEKTG